MFFCQPEAGFAREEFFRRRRNKPLDRGGLSVPSRTQQCTTISNRRAQISDFNHNIRIELLVLVVRRRGHT